MVRIVALSDMHIPAIYVDWKGLPRLWCIWPLRTILLCRVKHKIQCHIIYDTASYIHVRSETDKRRLNLPHGTDNKNRKTTSAGTVHTAYLRQRTSYQCRDMDPNPDPDRHQNLIIRSLAHCQPSLKISCKSVLEVFAQSC